MLGIVELIHPLRGPPDGSLGAIGSIIYGTLFIEHLAGCSCTTYGSLFFCLYY